MSKQVAITLQYNMRVEQSRERRSRSSRLRLQYYFEVILRASVELLKILTSNGGNKHTTNQLHEISWRGAMHLIGFRALALKAWRYPEHYSREQYVVEWTLFERNRSLIHPYYLGPFKTEKRRCVQLWIQRNMGVHQWCFSTTMVGASNHVWSASVLNSHVQHIVWITTHESWGIQQVAQVSHPLPCSIHEPIQLSPFGCSFQKATQNGMIVIVEVAH